jgi:hypothetical protein
MTVVTADQTASDKSQSGAFSGVVRGCRPDMNVNHGCDITYSNILVCIAFQTKLPISLIGVGMEGLTDMCAIPSTTRLTGQDDMAICSYSISDAIDAV